MRGSPALAAAFPAVAVLSVAISCGGSTAREPELRSSLPTAARPRALPDAVTLARGEALVERLTCTACHAAGPLLATRLSPDTPPDLSQVASRADANWLRAFLLAPRAERPDGLMPDLLASLPAGEREARADELAHFLATLGEAPAEEPVETDAGELERGRRLYHEVGCVACHEPQSRPWALTWNHWELGDDDPDGLAPELGAEDALDPPPPGRFHAPPAGSLRHLARKTGAGALAAYLRDPLAVRPDGRMPSCRLGEDEARAIAIYLLREQAPEWRGRADSPGLAFEYYEHPFGDGLPILDDLEPVTRGWVRDLAALPERREDQFAFRFHGFLRVPADGSYTLSTVSDDGSWLFLDGELLVDNGGQHPPVEVAGERWLEQGRHSIEVLMFEAGGGEELSVWWSGPGIEKETLPPDALTHRPLTLVPPARGWSVDPARAERGRESFARLGCASCHPLPGLQPSAARPLAELDPLAPDGCLGSSPGSGRPRYSLGGGDREALVGVIDTARARSFAPPTAAERVARTLERLGCRACHERDDRGGPHPERRGYFTIRGDAELGDEGRIPPHLEGVGAKLRRPWLEEVLLAGGTARPYMATRMPDFGADNVAHLPQLFEELDGSPADLVEPEFTTEAVELGRRLVGTAGLGCIQCHQFAGYDSLGVPAVDLAQVAAHVKPRWFERLLLDPIALKMNTRMPEFWKDGVSPVGDVLDGDPRRQIQAMWTYLSLGTSMPLPEGLIVPVGTYEVEVTDAPRLVGVFMEGVSPRTVCVGYPERAHVAFDVQNSRLAKAWRGRFFNAEGTWHARAGQLERPPVEDVFDLPPGPPFAFLDDPDQPWPQGGSREAGYRVLGRRFDAERRPHFRYAVGEVEVDEVAVPRIRRGSTWIRRRFELWAPAAPARPLWLRAALSDGPIQEREDRSLNIGSWDLRIVTEGLRPTMAGAAGEHLQVLLPVVFEPATDARGGVRAELEVEFTW